MQQQSGVSEGVLDVAMNPTGRGRVPRVTSAGPRPRSVHATQHRAAVVLLWGAALAAASARGLFVAARRLDAWLEKRRAAAAALRDFRTMSERELLDIGLSRVDVQRVAWGAHR